MTNVDTPTEKHPIRTLSLCSGIGMLDEATQLVFGRARTVCYVEREPFAASVLGSRMEEGSLAEAPIWTDLRTFDGKPWRGAVDCVVAGLPCQPYSAAGRQQGETDSRSFGKAGDDIPDIGDPDAGPVPHAARIISEARPAMALFENVPPWIRGGHARRFLEQLCGLGYRIARPLEIAAGEVEAPHLRKRVFVLAYDPSLFREAVERGEPNGIGERMADAESNGRRRDQQGRSPETRAHVGRASQDVDDADGARRIDTEIAGSQSEAHGGDQRGREQPQRRRRSVADADSQRRGDREEQHDRDEADQPGGEMELTGSDGPQGQPPAGTEARATCRPGGTPQLFPPQPQSSVWNEIQATAPHLLPAIENYPSPKIVIRRLSGLREGQPRRTRKRIETTMVLVNRARNAGKTLTRPAIHKLADGNAVVLDEARTDQLRCGGNGVVAIHAAVALLNLIRDSLNNETT